MIRSAVERIVRFVRRHGVAAMPRTTALLVWRRLFADEHFVFSLHAEPFQLRQVVDGLLIQRYGTLEEIPGRHFQQLMAEEGSVLLQQMNREFADGGVFWVATLEEHVVAYQWSRRGFQVERWFVPLEADDVVIFATVTFPQWRGRGIGPAMMQHIIANELAGRGRAYVDCKVWNKPAMRGIAKAGFTCMGRMQPL